MEAELAALRQQVAAGAESSAAQQQQLATETKELRDKVAALERQRAEAEVRAERGVLTATGLLAQQ